MKCLIDYAAGLHGHFLEYVISKYIYNLELDYEVFDEMGSCDVFATDRYYKNHQQIVMAKHFTADNRSFRDEVCPIIYIRHCNQLKYDYIWMVNFFYKVNFVTNGRKDQTEHRTKELVTNFRGNWYDKLETMQFHTKIGLFKECTQPNEKFDFRYEAFFSLQEFLIELRRVAKFLNRDIVCDDSLIQLWHTFISKNQGYNQYIKAMSLVDSIIEGESVDIEDDWQVHALILRRLTPVFNIWDGPLFEDVPFPKNTKEVHDLINQQGI